MRRQKVYCPECEDWVFHVALPLASHLMMAVSAYGAAQDLHAALFGVAAAALLLFIGIHDAWDPVTYHVFCKTRGKDAR